MVHQLNAPPSNVLGNNGDLAIYQSDVYIKSINGWIKINSNLFKNGQIHRNEVAIWDAPTKIKSSSKFKFDEISGLTINKIDSADSDTDKFLVSDNGVLKYRTGAQLLSDIGAISTDTTLTTEEVQDIVGAMFSSNTETRISATYQDGDGTIDLVVDDMSNVSGDSGNAAIYDNSGTPAFKSGITKAEVQSLLNMEDGATADQSQSDINGLAITTTGALNSGSITSGFGAIDNGSSNITTTGTVASGPSTSTSSTITGATLTTDTLTDNLLAMTQTLNAGSGENSGLASEVYSMIKGSVTDTDHAGWDKTFFINMNAGGGGADQKFTVDLTGKVTAEGGYDHFMETKIHQFYNTGTSAFYLPFGASVVESSFTSDALNDDTLLIAPYDGTLEFIKIQCTGGAGNTTAALRVAGTTKTALGAVSISSETTATFTWSSNNDFDAGERVRITIDPTSAVNYVTATSVWKYTI